MQRSDAEKDKAEKAKNSNEKMFGIFQPVDKKDIRVKDIFNRAKLGNIQNMPTFYKDSALPSLLNVATSSGGRNDREKVIRFLLSTNNNLIFAKEGPPIKDIPAHFQMANLNVEHAKCLTAGNAYFNEKGELSRIDHKSGDFRPPFDTLQFVFPALLKSGIPIAKELAIDRLDEKGGLAQRYTIDSSMIQQLKIPNQEKTANESANLNQSKLAKSTSTSRLFDKLGTDIATYDPKAAFQNQQGAKPDKSIEKKLSDNEVKKDYEQGIKELIGHLPDRSSTKKKYQKVLQSRKPGMCFSQLVSLANKAVEEQAASKKKHSDESTQIHKAISQATTEKSYESSQINKLVTTYSQKNESDSKRKPKI